MRFNTEELNPGLWIDLNPDKPEQGQLCLRVASVELLADLKKRHTKKKVTYHKHQPVNEETLDQEAYNQDLWDYSIVDWKGIQDQNGQDIACTKENKSKLMNGSPVFLTIYNRCIDRVNEQIEKAVEDEEKN